MSRNANRPPRFWISYLAILPLLLAGTAWNVTRSSALAEAERAATIGDTETALARALDHLDRQPWSKPAALLAARNLSRLDRSETAEPYYKRAGRLSLADQQLRAYAIVRGPHPEQAIIAYDKILTQDPDNLTALRRLAAVLLARNETQALLDLADRLDRIPRGAVLAATVRAVVHHNDKNREAACADFEKVLELDPQLKETPLARGLFFDHLAEDLVSTGRIDDARKYLERAVESSPNAPLWNWLGHIAFLKGELDQADRDFRRALVLDPFHVSSLINLAKVELQRKQAQAALEHLDQARAVAPRSYGVLYNLATVYRQLGRPAEADQIQESIRDLREDAAAHDQKKPWPNYAL